MKKNLLSLSLLCVAASSCSAAQTPTKVKNFFTVSGVIKDHLSSKDRIYFAKASAVTVAFILFVFLSYRGIKFVYNWYRAKSAKEKFNKIIYKQPSKLSYVKYVVVYVISCFVLVFAFKGVKKEFSTVYEQCSKLKVVNNEIKSFIDTNNDNDNETEAINV